MVADQDKNTHGSALSTTPALRTVQGSTGARQSQHFGFAPRTAQSNLLQKGRESSTLRAPQGSSGNTASVSKQLKVCSSCVAEGLSHWLSLCKVCKVLVQGVTQYLE